MAGFEFTRCARALTVAAMAIMAGGCISGGGSQDAKSGGVTSSPAAASTSTTTPGSPVVLAPAVVPAPAPGGGTTVTPTPFTPGPSVVTNGLVTQVRASDVEGRSLANRVVTFGQVFVPGHVTTGVVAALNGQALPTQVDVKRRHADGSVRHAILSVGIPASVAASTVDLELRQAGAMPAPGAAISVANALAGGFDLVIEVTERGTTYRASAAQALRASASRWLDGGVATEYRAVAPLAAAGTAHPTFEAMFDVRFFSSSGARVSVTLENALANASRGERTADIRILDERGLVLFSQAGVYVPAHSRMRKVFDWGTSAQTRVHVAPSLAYLVDTGAVPRYDTTKTLDPLAVSDVQAVAAAGLNEIYGNGPIVSYMPTTGGRPDIGVLPQWTAVTLYTGDVRAARVMYSAAELAGSWPVHLRDPATRKPYSIDLHPTVSNGWWGNQYAAPGDALPACATDCPQKDSLAATDPRRTNPAIYNRIHQFDTAHQPSLAFVPYLLSGDPYFLDELYFWAAANFLALPPDWRGRASGIVAGDPQTRSQAWSIRTLAQTAWIAPDADAEKAYHEQKLASNFAALRAAIAGNAWGVREEGSNLPSGGGRVQPEMATSVAAYYAPWQLDYFSTVLAYAEGLGYADARAVRDWMVKPLITRLTTPAEWNPYDALPYQIAFRYVPAGCGLLDPTPTTAGCPPTLPVYATLGEMYAATFARRATAAPTAFANAACAMCYEANARAALAGAVRSGVPKAREAYAFLDGELQRAAAQARSIGRVDAFLRDPTWLIVP